ncbi:MAG: glycosyltransferase, partial [Haliea sp.]
MTRTPDAPPLVVHIIYALGTGGLENGLVNIINRSPPGRYRHAIICLTVAEAFAGRLTAAGVEVVERHQQPGHDLGRYVRLWRTLRRLCPAIVHTRNLAALETQVLGLLLTGCKRVHGEHGRDVSDLDGSNRKYQWLRRLLSPLIHRYIAVSQDLAQWLVETVRIPPNKVTQIYNGVDHARFLPRFAEANNSGAALPARTPPPGMPAGFLPQAGCRVVGTVGRLAAVKDQQTLIRALAHIFTESPQQRQTLRC